MSKNGRFSDVFRRYRSRQLVENGLKRASFKENVSQETPQKMLFTECYSGPACKLKIKNKYFIKSRFSSRMT